MMIAVGMVGLSCSGEGTNNLTALRVLAKNVLLRTSVANAGTMQANGQDVDTTTQVLAENVIVDNTSLSISSRNAQDAFENIAPKLDELLIGTWSTSSYNNGATGQTGSITFNSDGTFLINNGTITVLGGCNLSNCDSTTGTWEVIDDSIVKMTLSGLSQEGFPQESQFPFPINYNKNKLTLIRASNITILKKG
jgi:hypothetical protein